MSVKLPIIAKKQPTVDNKFNQNPRQSKQIVEEESPKLQVEVKELNEHFDQLYQSEVMEPIETITVLKNKSTPQQFHEQQKMSSQRGPLKVEVINESKKYEQLQSMFQQKQKIIGDLRSSLVEKKKQIKVIGQQIDKDLNKSLFKASKQNNVNIRDIFSASVKSGNQRINQLNEQIKRVRVNVKKIKQQIAKIQQNLSNPVEIINQERGEDCQRRMRSTEDDIKTIEHEKTMLSEEIARGGIGVSEEEEKEKAQNLSKLTIQLQEIQNGQKQQKLQLYRIEKEDIVLMEKIKFFQEREGQLGIKKSKIGEKDKQKTEQQIRQVIQQINRIMQQRNKIQIQKRQTIKSLSTEISSFESKNWEQCSKLRQLDTFLLQYYEKKAKKREIKIIENTTIQVMQKSTSRRKDDMKSISNISNKSQYYENDKNKKTIQDVLVEKRKIYEFGVKQVQEDEINVSDQFLGPRLKIKGLVVVADQQKIYSIKVTYLNSYSDIIQGLTMGSKTKAEDVEILKLELDKGQIINFIHSGYCEKHLISFIHFVTSEGKQLKWGKLQNLKKSQQKHIKSYETSILKTKLVCSKDHEKMQFPYFLGGFSIVTTYLAPK